MGLAGQTTSSIVQLPSLCAQPVCVSYTHRIGSFVYERRICCINVSLVGFEIVYLCSHNVNNTVFYYFNMYVMCST